jgi:hypothetical protein
LFPCYHLLPLLTFTERVQATKEIVMANEFMLLAWFVY